MERRKPSWAQEKCHREIEYVDLQLAQTFLNVPFEKLDEAIITAMQFVAEYCNADRAVIYGYDWNSATASHLYEWDARPIYYTGNKLKTLPLTDMETAHMIYRKGKAYLRSSLEELPAGSSHRRESENAGINALCSYPIVNDSAITGITAFSTACRRKEWAENEIALIELFSKIIANILERKEQETTFREQVYNNQMILDSINEGVGMYDRDGNALQVNRHLAERFGKSKEECIGVSIRDLLPEDTDSGQHKLRKEKFDEAFNTGTCVAFESASGGRWFSNCFYPVLKNGKVTAITLCTTDITDKKTADEEARRIAVLEKEAEVLRSNEAAYLEILDGSTEATWIKDLVNGTCEYSKQWTERFGEDNIPAKKMNVFLSSLIHPEDRARLLEERAYICQNKLTKYKTQYRLKIADGSYIWVLDKGKVIYDEQGNPTKIFGTSTDITDQKKSAAYINILYETTGKILSSPTPRKEIQALCIKVMKFLDCHTFFNYLVIDGDPLLQLNACAGITEEQKRDLDRLPLGSAVCGCAIRDSCRIIAENIQTTEDPRTEFLKLIGIRAYVCNPLMADGKAIGGLAFGTRSRDQFSEEDLMLMKTVAESVAVAIKRKQDEETLLMQAEALLVADQNKNEFLAALSHELRNPLATISAGLSLLNVSEDKAQQEKAKAIIRRQMEQLCHLVDDLLDIMRITRNKIILKKERFELNAIARTVAEDLNTVFKEKDVHLNKDIRPYPIYINADPVRVKQIIGNLLHNALKFSENGGGVSLSVYKEKDNALIAVKDSGIGIDPEFMHHIFEPFTQADKAIDRGNGGLGLGLSIVKGIAELHGGSVKAYSDGPNKGSEFVICLPVSTPEEPTSPWQ